MASSERKSRKRKAPSKDAAAAAAAAPSAPDGKDGAAARTADNKEEDTTSPALDSKRNGVKHRKFEDLTADTYVISVVNENHGGLEDDSTTVEGVWIIPGNEVDDVMRYIFASLAEAESVSQTDSNWVNLSSRLMRSWTDREGWSGYRSDGLGEGPFDGGRYIRVIKILIQ